LIWDSLRTAAARETGLYARAAATQASRAMDFAQEALSAVGAQALTDLRKRGPDVVAETLTRQADADRETQWIGLFDPKGGLIAASSPDGPEFAGLVDPLGDRVEFARGFYVGLPVVASWRDRQLIPMTRRLYDADDRLEAVIVLLTTPEFLLALPTGSEPETRIQLRRGDGALLARVGPDQVDDRAIERAIDHNVLAPGDPGGVAVATNDLLVAALPLERYPLIAVAALPAPQLSDGGRPLAVLALLVLAVFVAVGAGAAWRWQRDEDRAGAAPDLETRLLGLLGRRLREPVSTIAQAATALMAEPLSVEQREQVFVLRRAAAALGRAAGDLADWAGPSDPPGETSFDPTALLAQLAAAAGPAARARGLRFDTVTDPDLPPSLTGDPARFTQLVAALIDQGIESTEAGIVRLLAGVVSQDGDAVTLEILVTDTSRPVDTAREDERRTRLDLARRMAAGLDGTLDVTSQADGGLAVRARLRLARGSAPAVDDGRQPRPAGNGLSILLIEDNSANRQVAAGLLGRLGHRIAPAADSESAFVLLEKQRFDLVLLDIHLPGRDGISTAAMIRAMPPPVGRIPIIALTADTLPSTAERCRAAGIDTVLTKPVRQADLAAAISRIAGPRNGSEPLLIDNAGVAELRAALSPDAIGSLLQQLATDIDDTLARLDAAAARGLFAEVARQAHVIKSVAATFALPALSDLAAVAEATARTLDDGGSTATAQELRAAALRPIAERSLAALRLALLPADLHETQP
jgi:CheY-like chemotaxis protein/signal transduction histidine kinase